MAFTLIKEVGLNGGFGLKLKTPAFGGVKIPKILVASA